MANYYAQFESQGCLRKVSQAVLISAGENPAGGAMEQDSDIVELYEKLLSRRAEQGVRPVLYISSCTDLECSLVVLLGDEEAARFVVPAPTPFIRSGYYFIKD